MCSLILILVCVWSIFAQNLPNDLPLTTIGKKGTYPRSIQLTDSSIISCNNYGYDYLAIYKDNKVLSTVYNPLYPNIAGTDYTDCFLFTSNNINNQILLTARFHTGCVGSHLVKGNSCKYYSLRTWVSGDQGKTWNPPNGSVTTTLSYKSNNPSNCGIWEPFIYETKWNNKINLMYYYALEYLDSKNNKQQNIVSMPCILDDKGVFTCDDKNIVNVSYSGSYDGMPSITQLSDGTLLCAMDTNYPCKSGHTWNTTSSIIKSFDGGETWNESSRHILYDLSDMRGWSSTSSGIAYNGEIIVMSSMLNNGVITTDHQYIIYSDSYDGYNWNSYTLVSTNQGFWPNVYLINNTDLYIEFNDVSDAPDAVSVRTTYPINRIPQQYIAFEYDINRYDQDIGSNYSPLKNVNSSYECYINCLYLSNEQCMTFNYDSVTKDCYLKNGDGYAIVPANFNPKPGNYSNVLSSRWYYGRNTNGIIYKTINNIKDKDECLFECLSFPNDCKHVIWNNKNNECQLKSTTPIYGSISILNWNIWLWIVPPLTTSFNGEFVSQSNKNDVMYVNKYGMSVYNVNITRWMVYTANFTYNFPSKGVITMSYMNKTDSWNEQGINGNVIWTRNAQRNF
eukprot:552267_1